VTLVNQIVGWLFELLVQPLRGLPPLAGLAIISLVTAILMLIVFRATSNQPAIAAAKRRLEAGLFEIRLFDDDPRLVLRALGDLLRANLAYVRRSIVPLLWMFVPLTLAIAQLQAFYGYRAVAPGDAFLVKAKLATEDDARAPATGARRPAAQLRVPPGLRVETQDVWIPPLAELAWRVRAERAGRYRVELQLDGATAAKDIRVGRALERLSPVRRQPDFTHAILYPVEPPLPKPGPVRSIHVEYAPRDVGVLAWRLPWLIVFFVLVMAFAWLLKGRFRVTL
jgi:hypothetical protein